MTFLYGGVGEEGFMAPPACQDQETSSFMFQYTRTAIEIGPRPVVAETSFLYDTLAGRAYGSRTYR